MPRVLVLEDDRESLDALAARLAFWFRAIKPIIDTADAASAGLILAGEHAYDCLLLDVVMPGVNGLKFVEQVRERQPDARVILMSGRDDDRKSFERLGVCALLAKPIDFPALRKLVAFALSLDATSGDPRSLAPAVNRTVVP